MKKMMFALVVAAVAMPALAQEPKIPQGDNAPAIEMQRDHEAFKKAHEQHEKQMKATKEKLEKLVKEYNKASGKKKDAKRAEIATEVRAIHEKQLEFKKEQLSQFEQRLSRMKADFEAENAAAAQDTWVNEKTDALIQADGNLKVLFGPRPGEGVGRGPRMGRHHKGFKGPRPDFKGEAPRPDLDD